MQTITLNFFPFWNFTHAIPLLERLSPAFQYLLVTMLGAVTGSFLSVVVYRLPKMFEYAAGFRRAISRPLTLAYPPSHCPQCQHRLRFWENIPLLSYLALRGRCAGCRAFISLLYPFLEIAGAGLAALALWSFGPIWQGLAAFALLAVLLALACIDQASYLLPDTLTLPLLWAGLLVNVNRGFVLLEEAVLGAAAGYVLLWCVYWAFLFIRKKEGLGYGDFKLLAAIGAWQGVYALPEIVLIASFMGLVVGALQCACRWLKNREQRLAFGPYLSLSAAITLCMPGLPFFFERSVGWW